MPLAEQCCHAGARRWALSDLNRLRSCEAQGGQFPVFLSKQDMDTVAQNFYSPSQQLSLRDSPLEDSIQAQIKAAFQELATAKSAVSRAWAASVPSTTGCTDSCSCTPAADGDRR